MHFRKDEVRHVWREHRLCNNRGLILWKPGKPAVLCIRPEDRGRPSMRNAIPVLNYLDRQENK